MIFGGRRRTNANNTRSRVTGGKHESLIVETNASPQPSDDPMMQLPFSRSSNYQHPSGFVGNYTAYPCERDDAILSAAADKDRIRTCRVKSPPKEEHAATTCNDLVQLASNTIIR